MTKLHGRETLLYRRRTLAVLVVATVVLLGLDLTRSEPASYLRTGAAAAFGPLERAIAVGGDADVARLTREREELAGARRQDEATLRQAREVTSVLGSPSAKGANLLAAQVVGLTPAASSGERRVTIDVGSRDGVTKDLTVIAGAGLVGRVTMVAPWTSDVLAVGDRSLTVGVRVGVHGRLGSVSAGTPVGGTPPGPGRLSLTLLEQGTVGVGDTVTALGSAEGRPFRPDAPVGTVVWVDPDHGQLTSTAIVEPAVDLGTLDVVAVVLSSGRSVPRPPTSGPTR
jgi:rod shape-determining protein MreC